MAVKTADLKNFLCFAKFGQEVKKRCLLLCGQHKMPFVTIAILPDCGQIRVWLLGVRLNVSLSRFALKNIFEILTYQTIAPMRLVPSYFLIPKRKLSPKVYYRSRISSEPETEDARKSSAPHCTTA